ncbi:MAG: hypothetical protein OEY93_10030 [Anaerolineae bacterium]|nr:hypothetical protein [Anaerolineae bacterium]
MANRNEFKQIIKSKLPQRGLVWGVLILGALLAFEIFNFSTTEFAMTDLLGDLRFAGLRWSTILALAFCGIDFAGIARIFTPEQGSDETKEIWYLFGAWMLAATMNAMLTWWGVTIAILSHNTLGNEVISRATLIQVVPVFVALMVWLIRVLIIGTFSVAGERLFSQNNEPTPRRAKPARATSGSFQPTPAARAASGYSYQPSLKRVSRPRSSYPQAVMKSPDSRSDYISS